MRSMGKGWARATTALALAVLVAVAAACGGTTTSAGGTSGSAATPTTAGSAGSGAPSGSADATTTPGSTPGVATSAPRPSPGCGTSKVRAVDGENHPMQVAGAERFYLLTTPAAHDGVTPLPLVFDFHGLSEGAQVHTKMSNFGELAKKEGFVVVFPNGHGTPLRWDTNPDHQPNEDLQFVDAMFEQLEADLCIDTSRVYSTGLSYGAIMTSFLLCNRSDKFAAVAPVAGLQMPKTCAPSRRVPILTFHGTADPILKFDGTVGDIGAILQGKTGETTAPTVPPDLNGPGYPANVAAWAKRNGCGDKATDTKISESVVHRVYPCPAGADVEFDIILGGGHAWPGSEFSKSIEKIVGPTTFEIDATKEAWAFFRRFALPAS